MALEGIGAEFAFLLNQCPAVRQNAGVQDGAEALKEMGGLIAPLILARVEYKEAARHGRGVTELYPQGAATEEMRGLWLSIERRLAQATAGGAARKAA
ncbi:MAG TPA: hypothetical protein VLI91_11220 [Roseiarcus sp.]|nr:hypothetical protein [Roseiarcus sp.]